MERGNEYEIKLSIIETTEGYEYVAEIPELKGCVGSGNSYDEALEEVLENKNVYLDTLIELGRKIPIPKQKKNKFSGKLSLRLSSNLHQKVSLIADELDVSINQYIVEVLAESVGSNNKIINMTKEKMKQKEEFVLKDRENDKIDCNNLFLNKKIGGMNSWN